jgi:hypothetical protein
MHFLFLMKVDFEMNYQFILAEFLKKWALLPFSLGLQSKISLIYYLYFMILKFDLDLIL